MNAILLDHFRRYTLAYFLAFLFFVMSSGTQFIDTFSSLTKEQMAVLAWWQVIALFWKSIISGVGAILAFLNKHMSRIAPSGVTPPELSPPTVQPLVNPNEVFVKLP